MVVNTGQLIDLVYARDPLWNTKNGYYHNREMKNFLWNEIATELGVTRETVRTKWSCLRDSFRRELKKRNDPAYFAKGQWPFFERMLFLTSTTNSKDTTFDESYGETIGGDQDLSSTITVKPEIVMSPTSGPCNMSDSTRELPSTTGQVCVDYETSIKEEPNVPSTTYQAPPQLLRLLSSLPDSQPDNQPIISPQKPHNTASAIKKERHKLKKIRKKMKRDKKRDEDYYFALSMVSFMKKVPENNKIKMRVALMDTINSFQAPNAQTFCDNSNSTNCAQPSSDIDTFSR